MKMMQEKPFPKKPWYNWLINYILKPIKIMVSGDNDKILSLFKTNITKNYTKPTSINNVYEVGKRLGKPKKKKKIKTT